MNPAVPRLRRVPEERDSGRTAASVTICAAICTRDRPVELWRALRSLLNQRRSPEEILVVDNVPSGEASRRVVESSGPRPRYVREPREGLDFARNRALAETEAEVVAFLDDDAVAAPGWVEATAARFREAPRLAAVMGRVEALSLEAAGHRLFEANGGFGRGPDPVLLPRDAGRRLNGLPAPLAAWTISIGSGASMALRRRCVLAVGGFDEALDMGPFLAGGGDLDMLWRLLQAGYEVAYEPEILAFHEHRCEARAAAAQIVEHNRALMAVLLKAATRARGRRRVEILAFLGWRLLKPGVRLVRRGLGRDPLPVPALLRLWWATWQGLVAYPAALRRARRIAREAT